MTANLKQILDNLKKNPSSKYASQVLMHLSKNDTYNHKIYQYQNHRFAPKDVVINALQYFASHEDSQSARDDIRDSNNLDSKYDDRAWIDCKYLKPVTAEQVRSIIINGIDRD